MPEINKWKIGNTTFDIGSSGGEGLSDAVKAALLGVARSATYSDDGHALSVLEKALFPVSGVTALAVSVAQSYTIYDTDSIDSLRAIFTVTATINGAQSTVTDYAIGGNLVSGQCEITVYYGGQTATATVTVTQDDGWRNDHFVITSDDLINGRIVESSPYHDNDIERVNYTKPLALMSSAFRYTVTYGTDLESSNIGVRTYTAAQLDRILNGQSVSGTDSGWVNSGYTWNGLEGGFVFFVFRANSGNTNIFPSDIKTITITREAK